MDLLNGIAPTTRSTPSSQFALSVVVPVFNEDEVLPEFHRRLAAVLDRVVAEAEVVYVNDGSTDHTATCLARLHELDPRVAVIELSRNFGKEIAMSAGLDYARGDAIVVIDADLQDPPECIPDMVNAWQAGSRRHPDAASEPRERELVQAGDREFVLPRDRPYRHRDHPEGRR